VAHGIQAAVLFSNPDIGASFTNTYLRHLFPSDRAHIAGALLAAVIAAVFSLVICAGLWFLQNWARLGLLMATGIPLGRGLVAAVATLATNPSAFSAYFGGAFCFATLVYGAIVLYLVQPNVQCAFTGRKEFYDAYDSESGLDRPSP
jgi:hypothetical protein